MRFNLAIIMCLLGQSFVVTERPDPQFIVTDIYLGPFFEPIKEVHLKPEPAKVRPVVVMYTAGWCAPCTSAKTNWKDYAKSHDVPFDMVYRDVDNHGFPTWSNTIPAYSFEVDRQTRYVIGYPGAEKLIARWQATQPKPLKSGAQRPP